jgi:hypothetical protein
MEPTRESGLFRRRQATGRAHDRVAAPDPAAATLRADAEAAGHPALTEPLAATAHGPGFAATGDSQAADQAVRHRAHDRASGGAWLMGAVFAALAALGLAAAFVTLP